MGKHINLLIIPAEGGGSRRFRIRTIWLRVAGWGLVIGLGVIIWVALHYSQLFRRAFDWQRLALENERLKEENRRIVRVAQEVEQSRIILTKIIRSLGNKVDLNEVPLPSPISLNNNPIRPSYETEQTIDASEIRGTQGSESSSEMGTKIIVIDGEASPPKFPPLHGFLSRRFQNDPLFPERAHRGIDIAGKEGSPVVSAADGQVIFSGWNDYFGNCLMIAHRGGYLTLYGHLLRPLKEVLQEVKAGEPIGLVGSTGKSTAPHLHFEIWKDGTPLDPIKFIRF
ncbi:MAG: peptidoglycan DD-metalloendopeptidase family protein [bacterium]